MAEIQEYVFNDIEEMKTIKYSFNSIPGQINIVIEGDCNKITMDDYHDILENFSNQLPEENDMAYSYNHKTDIDPPYRIRVTSVTYS